MTKVFAIGLGVIAILALAPPVLAAEWWFVDTSNGARRVSFADRASVELFISGDIRMRKSWTSSFNNAPDKFGISTTKEYYYYDCNRKESAIKSYIDYDDSGSVIRSKTISDDDLKWDPVAPRNNR